MTDYNPGVRTNDLDRAAEARERANELLLLAILASVVMLFAGFTSAYLIRRTGIDWRRAPLPAILWFNTVVLLASSATIELARRGGSRRWISATLVLGLAFLAGQLAAWRVLVTQGIFVSTHPHGSFIYMLSAVHGVHLLGGIIALVYATALQRNVGLCATYWHFVDGVWLYVLMMLSVL